MPLRDGVGNVLDDAGNVLYPAGSPQAVAWIAAELAKPQGPAPQLGHVVTGHTGDFWGNYIPVYADTGPDWSQAVAPARTPDLGASSRPAPTAAAATPRGPGIVPVPPIGSGHWVYVGGVRAAVTDGGQGNNPDGWRVVEIGGVGTGYLDQGGRVRTGGGVLLGTLDGSAPGSGGGSGGGGGGSDGGDPAGPGFDLAAFLRQPVVLGAGALLLAAQLGVFSGRRR